MVVQWESVAKHFAGFSGWALALLLKISGCFLMVKIF